MPQILSGGKLLREVRRACGMSLPDFARALGEELGWTPPTGLMRAWEESDHDLPDDVDRAVRRVAANYEDRREPATGPSRREFLDGAARLSGLVVLDAAMVGTTEPVSSMPIERRSRYQAGASLAEVLSLPAATEASVPFLSELLASYRSAYGMTSAEFLLPRLGGLVPIFQDLERSTSSSPVKMRVTSLLGQAAVMAGVLSLMRRVAAGDGHEPGSGDRGRARRGDSG
jgi:hypothetical protein